MLQHIKCRQHNKTEKCRVSVEQNESSVDSGAVCKTSLGNNDDQRFNGQDSESVNACDTEAESTDDFVRLPV